MSADDFTAPDATEAIKTELGDQYSSVMEGIGRVALASSFLEFSVDSLGWSLTSDLQVYHALTDTMSVASKANRLAELAKEVIIDEELRGRTVNFCKGVRPLLEQSKEIEQFIRFITQKKTRFYNSSFRNTNPLKLYNLRNFSN